MTTHARVSCLRAALTLTLCGVALACATPAAGPQARLAVEVLPGLSRVPAWEPAAPARVELLVDVRPALARRRVGRAGTLDAVRAAARQLLEGLPEATPVTLHALGAGRGGDCEPESALAEPVSGDPATLVDAVERARPRTRASLAMGLDRLADALARDSAAPRARVIVISDLAAECGGDVCAAGRAIVATGASFTLVAIGDGSTPECVAEWTAPEGPPAPLATVVPFSAPRFRATPVAARPGAALEATVSGVAGAGPVTLLAGVARVEIDLVPPLVIPELALTAGALQRVRVLDFPGASPPLREWQLETLETAMPAEPAGPVDGPPAAASPP